MTMRTGLANDHAVRADADPRRPDDQIGGDGPDDADPAGDPQDATLEDWIEADKARPTLPEETADGLDDMEEEIRHQAEDLPLDKGDI